VEKLPKIFSGYSAPVQTLSSAKIYWSCANIIAANQHHRQVNFFDPKPQQTTPTAQNFLAGTQTSTV
jgi:hypothetical protein